VLGAALAVGILPSTSMAEPQRSIADVQRQVDALNAKVDAAVEAYDQARIELSAAARRTAAAQHRLAQQAKVIALQHDAMSQVAVAAYRTGGADQFVSLVTTSNPESFLDRAASLNQISTRQSDALQGLQVAQLAYQQARAVANQQLAQQKKIAASLKTQRDAIQSALSQQQTLLSSLQASERRRLAALAAARAAAARAQAMSERATYNGPASGQAAAAVRFAYGQLGKPYQWGASGPSSYDCSGLTMASWAAAGVSLPHSSSAQYGSGPHVSRGDLQPGDLVFFGSPIHHVGIYIGGGKMIHAPHTGTVVQISPLESDYAGAVRP
jgi:cell wall-associated NlpC family hydrolase/outer membrane murein-binding lipoprotein Lpp